MLLPPEKTLFVPGPHPALLLADAPVHEALPALDAPDGAVPTCAGWSVVPKLTLCVVDGPGDAGCLVPAFGAPVVGGAGTPDDMAGWCEDVMRAGGVLVLSLPELPRTLDWQRLLTGGVSRGGFVPLLPD